MVIKYAFTFNNIYQFRHLTVYSYDAGKLLLRNYIFKHNTIFADQGCCKTNEFIDN